MYSAARTDRIIAPKNAICEGWRRRRATMHPAAVVRRVAVDRAIRETR